MNVRAQFGFIFIPSPPFNLFEPSPFFNFLFLFIEPLWPDIIGGSEVFNNIFCLGYFPYVDVLFDRKWT